MAIRKSFGLNLLCKISLEPCNNPVGGNNFKRSTASDHGLYQRICIFLRIAGFMHLNLISIAIIEKKKILIFYCILLQL